MFLTQLTAAGLGWALAGCAPEDSPASRPVEEAAAPTAQPALAQAPTAEPTRAPASAAQAPTGASPTRPATAAPSAPTAQAPAAEPTPAPAQSAYLAVARGANAEEITMRAIAAIGGIERFVKNGHDVIIKPNVCNNYHGPEYASTTNPEVVAALVKLCLGAGAKRVRVMDFPFAGSADSAYVRSGMQAAVQAAGGEMEVMAAAKYVEVDIPSGRDLKKWSFYRPIMEADVVINVPVAKHHSLARLTLGGKNLMGTIQDRGSIHRNLGQRIADITSLVRPELTVIDAVRILMANGPTGGNLNDVKLTNTVIASHDLVAADAYATSLFGLKPEDIAYIVASAEMGLGTKDLSGVKVEELNV